MEKRVAEQEICAPDRVAHQKDCLAVPHRRAMNINRGGNNGAAGLAKTAGRATMRLCHLEGAMNGDMRDQGKKGHQASHGEHTPDFGAKQHGI